MRSASSVSATSRPSWSSSGVRHARPAPWKTTEALRYDWPMMTTLKTRQLKGALTSAIHTEVKSSLIMRLSCGNTLKSPWGARTFWVRATASVSAAQPQCTVKIVTNRG
jgi:hypothetical protein